MIVGNNGRKTIHVGLYCTFLLCLYSRSFFNLLDTIQVNHLRESLRGIVIPTAAFSGNVDGQL